MHLVVWSTTAPMERQASRPFLRSGAAKGGRARCSQLCTAPNRAALNIRDSEGWNALSTAVHEGHHLIVKALVEGGCDIEAVENQGYTALMWAAEEGRVDTTSFLIEQGAQLDVQNNQGGTALMWVCDSVPFLPL